MPDSPFERKREEILQRLLEEEDEGDEIKKKSFFSDGDYCFSIKEEVGKAQIFIKNAIDANSCADKKELKEALDVLEKQLGKSLFLTKILVKKLEERERGSELENVRKVAEETGKRAVDYLNKNCNGFGTKKEYRANFQKELEDFIINFISSSR